MTMRKQYSLPEHLTDVTSWYYAQKENYHPDANDRLIIFFTAYERWLNDRVLLTEEEAGV